ncbi:hypothetical protein EI94DRAFT_1667989 [Lactarius quietus]|nr:hypothetical protein EI94DRAFT_1667989 [Lactarius quietus]
MQSKQFSFRQTVRSFFSTSSDNPASNRDPGVVSVSAGQVDAPSDASDVAMSAIQMSLSALQVGSAFATKIPYIAPVAGLLLQTLAMLDEVKQYKEECTVVMRKVARIANVVINVGKSCEKYNLNERDLPDGVRTILGSLQRELAGVEHILKKCAKEKGVKGFLLRKDLLTKIKQCDGELSNVLEAVLLELSLDSRFAQIAEARETAVHSNPTEEIPTLPQEPNTPQIFFGRDAELTQIIRMIFSGIASFPARIAILGPGGYGKTTLANAVLTHDRIQKHFGDARHFVTCESIFSSEALLIELGKTLCVLDGPPNALWLRIRTVLSTGESILCLDNFESTWDQSDEIKHSVEELLSRITVLHHVTLLITMRGAERPARTHWSQPFLEPLDTFGQAAARQVWQAIAGNYNDYAEKLTTAVDYVPLAVNLLAHLSQMTPPMLLWEEWSAKQTKVIQMGQMHRLSDLEYSIQLSIDSKRMKANPTAKSLLGVLSMLSDGLHVKHLKQFEEMLIDIDIATCLRTLQQCSLIKLTEERYQLHPIIHHFCKNEGLILPVHKAILDDYYLNLASNSYDPPSNIYGEIALEANNIKAVLLGLLQSKYKNQSKLIDAIINFTWFQIRIGNFSDKLISLAVHFVQKNHGAISLLIECLSMWGRVYHEARNIESAQEKLKEAEKLCQSSSNVNSVSHGDVLLWLGNTYEMQDALNDALAYYKRALKIYKRTYSSQGQGFALTGLGWIYIRLGQWDKTITSYQTALQLHKHNNGHKDSSLIQGNSHHGLAEVYVKQTRLVEAEAEIQKAIKSYKACNSILGEGNSHLLLGRLYLELNQPDKAKSACQLALELHIIANDPLSQGQDHCELGNVYLFQENLNGAENSYMIALELHKSLNSSWCLGNDFYGLGRVYMRKQELKKARGMFEEAVIFHRKSQDKTAEQKDEKYLSELLSQIE